MPNAKMWMVWVDKEGLAKRNLDPEAFIKDLHALGSVSITTDLKRADFMVGPRCLPIDVNDEIPFADPLLFIRLEIAEHIDKQPRRGMRAKLAEEAAQAYYWAMLSHAVEPDMVDWTALPTEEHRTLIELCDSLIPDDFDARGDFSDLYAPSTYWPVHEAHDAWQTILRKKGWIFSPTLHRERKEHPMLTKWESLTAEQKERYSLLLPCIASTLAAAYVETRLKALPQIEDLHKARIDITHGEDSAEYVQRLRDEQDKPVAPDSSTPSPYPSTKLDDPSALVDTKTENKNDDKSIKPENENLSTP